jgi:hypothetical protein
MYIYIYVYKICMCMCVCVCVCEQMSALLWRWLIRAVLECSVSPDRLLHERNEYGSDALLSIRKRVKQWNEQLRGHSRRNGAEG